MPHLEWLGATQRVVTHFKVFYFREAENVGCFKVKPSHFYMVA